MRQFFPFVLAGLLLVSGFVVPQVRAQDDQDQLTASLERRITDLEAALAEQTRANELTFARLEETVRYLNKMSKGAKTMMGQIDQVEELGFVPGMNYPSRELLLDAFRGFWGGMQDGVPQAAKKTEEEQTAAGGRR